MLDAADKQLLVGIFGRHAYTIVTEPEPGEELVLTASPVQPDEMIKVEHLITYLYAAQALEQGNFSGLVPPGKADFSIEADPTVGYLVTDSPTTALLLQLTAMN